MTADQPVPYRLAKYLTDKAISFAIAVVASPVAIAVIVTMAVDMLLCPADRGPWLYRERRVSRGKEVDGLKLRVLRLDVLTRMREAGEEHARLYEADVNNLTWAGRHAIKKWYFDKLPQLLNILRGDMSLVGPRPWPLSMVEAQEARGLTYRRRALAGWTGPSQLQKGQSTLPLSSETPWNTWPLAVPGAAGACGSMISGSSFRPSG